MLGILVQLAISWLLIYLIERKHLGVLGLMPLPARLRGVGLLLVFAAACCALGFLLKHVFGDLQWRLNPALSPAMAVQGLWWQLRSVLFEELIFRGVLLYILISRTGVRTGIVCSAIAFGVYHWFSYGVVGNPVAMLITFFLTGSAGLLFAAAYARAASLYAPIALHLGWNLVQGFVFPDGPVTATILRAEGATAFRTDSLPLYLLVTLLPVTVFMLGGLGLLRRMWPGGRPAAIRQEHGTRGRSRQQN